MKKYLHSKFIKSQIYPIRLCIVFSNDVEKTKEFMYKNSDLEDFELEYGHTYIGRMKDEKGGGFACIYMLYNTGSEEKIRHGHIAHECLHALAGIYSRIEQDLNYWGEETNTYLLQWLVDETYKFGVEKFKSKFFEVIGVL